MAGGGGLFRQLGRLTWKLRRHKHDYEREALYDRAGWVCVVCSRCGKRVRLFHDPEGKLIDACNTDT